MTPGKTMVTLFESPWVKDVTVCEAKFVNLKEQSLSHAEVIYIYGRVRFDVPCFRAGKIDFRRWWSLLAKFNIRTDPFAIWTDPFAKLYIYIYTQRASLSRRAEGFIHISFLDSCLHRSGVIHCLRRCRIPALRFALR